MGGFDVMLISKVILMPLRTRISNFMFYDETHDSFEILHQFLVLRRTSCSSCEFHSKLTCSLFRVFHVY